MKKLTDMERIKELENLLLVLTAKHTALFSLQCETEMEFIRSVQAAEVGRQIRETLKELHTLTGNEIYTI